MTETLSVLNALGTPTGTAAVFVALHAVFSLLHHLDKSTNFQLPKTQIHKGQLFSENVDAYSSFVREQPGRPSHGYYSRTQSRDQDFVSGVVLMSLVAHHFVA